MVTRLREKLERRQKVFATTISYVRWSGIIQRMKNDVVDFLVFDFEHGVLSTQSGEEMIRMCNVIGLPVVVRIADIEYPLISSALDIGADGILVPRVQTVEQALRAVECVRFPPLGRKGCGGFSLLRGADPASSVSTFNGDRLIFLQIESVLGIENLGSIIDAGDGQFAGIIVGPTDLSISMSIPLQFQHPRLVEAIKEVLKVCRAKHLSCGLFCNGTAEISYWRQEGMNIIWAGSDLGFLLSGYAGLCDFVRTLD